MKQNETEDDFLIKMSERHKTYSKEKLLRIQADNSVSWGEGYEETAIFKYWEKLIKQAK
jgi:hypothetical protein